MTDKGWAHFFARVIVGILFFMAGFWKTFELTPMQHARGGFVEGYVETWIPLSFCGVSASRSRWWSSSRVRFSSSDGARATPSSPSVSSCSS